MKKKLLSVLLAVLMLPCLFLFSACGKGDGGDNDTPKDLSSKNPEYIEFRNIMNTVASAFGTDIGLGEDANATASSSGGTTASGYAVSAGIGFDFNEITDSFLTKLKEFEAKTPDYVYDDPLFGFEEAIASCFKLPVQMVDAITQYQKATKAYGKVMHVGYDDPSNDETYYIVDKKGNNISSIAYSPTTTNYQTGSDEPIVGGYYLYYTEVQYISKDNFSFCLLCFDEERNHSQIIVGDSNYNLLAFGFDAGFENIILNYSNGDKARSRRFTSDSILNEEMRTLFNNAVSSFSEEYVESRIANVDYKISTAQVDAVMDRISEEMGFSSDDKYPGWGVSEDGKTVTGYYGTGTPERIEKLVIPSDFTQIDGNFSICAISVEELVIPSTITKVMLTRQLEAERNDDWYSGDYPWEYVSVAPSHFGIAVYSNRQLSVVKKITLEETNGTANQIFNYDSQQHCLTTKDDILLYVCDAPVEEYDFTGMKLGYSLQWAGSYKRENVENIKKISMDVTITTGDAEAPDYWRYSYPLLEMFMGGSNNKIYLDELNLYNFNESESNKNEIFCGAGPSLFASDLFYRGNYDEFINKLGSYIKVLNIYGDYKHFQFNDGYDSMFNLPVSDDPEVTIDYMSIYENGIELYKIKTIYDYYNLCDDTAEYLEKIGLLEKIVEDLGNGMVHEYYDDEIYSMLNKSVMEFCSAYEYVIYQQYKADKGENFRAKFIEQVNFKNAEAEITDLTTEHLVYKGDGNSSDPLYKHHLYLNIQDYKFINTLTLDPSVGTSYNLQIEGFEGEHLDVYISSAIIDVKIYTYSYLTVHLPWTQTTFEAKHLSKINDGDLTGLNVVYATEDDNSVYSTWLYSTIWDSETNSEKGKLIGYYSNNPETHEITLPTDVDIISRDFLAIGNISKVIIPANYKYVVEETSNEIYGNDYPDGIIWSFLIYNLSDLAQNYNIQFEVEAGNTLFAVDEDGNLCNASKSRIIRYYFTISNVLDLTDSKILSNLTFILNNINLAGVTEVIVDGRITVVEECGYYNYETAYEWKQLSKTKLTNVTTITLKNVGEIKPEYTDAYIDELVAKYNENYDPNDSLAILYTADDIKGYLSGFNFNGELLSSGKDKKYTIKLEGTLSSIDMNMVDKYSWTGGSGTVETLYANGTLVTPENAVSLGFRDVGTRFADNSEITELVVTTNQVNPSVYYTSGTITSIRFAEGITNADFRIFYQVNYSNYSANNELITDVYFGSTVVSAASSYSFIWSSSHIINVHFAMTKQEFIDWIGDDDTELSQNDLIRWFDWMGPFDSETYEYGNYLSQLKASNYDKYVDSSETFGYRFYFTDSVA